MALSEKQFRQYLALYGSEIHAWPEDIRAEAMRAQASPSLGRLVTEQHDADEIMLSHRRFEPASHDLAERIINAARKVQRPARISVTSWLQDFLVTLIPQPAMALTAMLTLGVAIGFGLPALVSGNSGNPSVMQLYMEDDGATL